MTGPGTRRRNAWAPSSAVGASSPACRCASLLRTTSLSNAYLSQLERALHLPSVRVLKLLSEALNVSAKTLLAQAGLLELAPSGIGPRRLTGPQHRRWSLPSAPRSAWPTSRRPR